MASRLPEAVSSLEVKVATLHEALTEACAGRAAPSSRDVAPSTTTKPSRARTTPEVLDALLIEVATLRQVVADLRAAVWAMSGTQEMFERRLAAAGIYLAPGELADLVDPTSWADRRPR